MLRKKVKKKLKRMVALNLKEDLKAGFIKLMMNYTTNLGLKKRLFYDKYLKPVSALQANF